MRYKQQLNYRKRRRFIARIWLAVFTLLVIIAGFVSYIYYENFKASNFNSPEQTTSSQTTSTIAPSIQVFRSPFFQFQTDKSWTEDTQSSKEGVYVYRSLQSGLLEQQLTIYVNNAPADLAVTRVLVANPNGNRGLTVLKVSEHCGKLQAVKGPSVPVTIDQIKFLCFGDDTRFNVLVGVPGGTTNISLPRPDGSMAAYTIYYSDVTANPNAKRITEIINTFQSR